MVAADEVGLYLGNTDVSALNNDTLYEIEIKVSKSDLWHGEAKKKEKHDVYRTLTWKDKPVKEQWAIPHYFYICVPINLLDETVKWTAEINEKYGVLCYEDNRRIHPEKRIHIHKRAKLLHKVPKGMILKTIAMRLSSCNIVQKRRANFHE